MSNIVLVRSVQGIEEYVHKGNNLRILLAPTHVWAPKKLDVKQLYESDTDNKDVCAPPTPVATFNITYHVGSRNECAGNTGYTHALEHILFKGSKKYNKERGTSIWSVLQGVGASLNATTYKDRTNYFETISNEYLDVAMSIEADRMRNAFIRQRDIDSEMTVVRNEFERGENSPMQSLSKEVWAAAYISHPYHVSTIGWRSDVEAMTAEKLRKFYNTYYWPNNATITVSGTFDKCHVLQMIDYYFGCITPSPHVIDKYVTQERRQYGLRRVEVRRATGAQAIVKVAHKSPPALQADTYALHVLDYILSSGKSSRLHKELVETGLATSANVDSTPLQDAGLFIVYALVSPDKQPKEIEDAILSLLEKLKQQEVSDEELERAKQRIIIQKVLARDGSYAVVDELNEAIAHGDWTYYPLYTQRISQVTKADVLRVSNRYLQESQRTIGTFFPVTEEKEKEAEKEKKEPLISENQDALALFDNNKNVDKKNEKENEEENIDNNDEDDNEFVNGRVQSKTKKNFVSNNNFHSNMERFAVRLILLDPVPGIRMYALHSPVLDIVTIEGSLLGGELYSLQTKEINNPYAAIFTVAMLDEGTTKKTKFEISDLLEKLGASVSFSVQDAYRVGFSAKMLRKDTAQVLSLLAEQLREPRFDDKDFERIKRRALASIKNARTDPSHQAAIAFANKSYAPGHPNYSFTLDEQEKFINDATLATLKSFHASAYGTGKLNIVFVGDLGDVYEIKEQARQAFGEWRTSALQVPEKPSTRALRPDSIREKNIDIPDKASSVLYVAQPVALSMRSNLRDYEALNVGVFILGGNFSSRLMQNVRDKLGLTYGIRASILGGGDGADAYIRINGTFATNLLDAGLVATLEQIDQWVSRGVTQDELDTAKRTIVGAMQVSYDTTSGLASQILSIVEQEMPLSELDARIDRIRSLTLQDVNSAIQKYISRNSWSIIKSGSNLKQKK